QIAFLTFIFLARRDGDYGYLPSFPTRRSSDLMRGVTLGVLREKGWARLNVPTPYLPYAEGGFTTPSGKCEFVSPRLAEMGLDPVDRKSTRLNSSHLGISYAVFCLKKKIQNTLS